jgi:hypothetical protein
MLSFVITFYITSLSSSQSTLHVASGLGTGKPSLFKTGLAAGGKFGYCTVCLDLPVPSIFVKQI